MNTGLQDAHNLACKLADVLQGRASDDYLDRYGAERMPVARLVIAFTERGFGIATATNPVVRMLTRAVIPLVGPIVGRVLPHVPLGRRLFGYVSQTRIHYWLSESAKSDARGRRGPVVGRRLPPFADNHESLRGFAWQVHAYGVVSPSVLAAVSAATGVPVVSFGVPRGTALRDGHLYLVRPDGFVAAEGVADAAARVLAAALPWHPASPA